jgi:peptidoglycan/xylan/chitin deacetylase (PgdA/CDA1 family)
MESLRRALIDLVYRWQEPLVRAVTRLIPADVLWFVDTGSPVFALTFDDGPDPHTTPGLLAALAAHRARATFFLVGERVQAHPELAAAIVAGGHEIGNHMMRDEVSARQSATAFRDDLARTGELLAPYGPVRWFRPGSGWFTPRMLRTAAGQGLHAVLGTLVAGHRGGPGDARIGPRLLAGIRPGSIVVLHEGSAKRAGVAATTDELLGALARKGLSAVTVSELAGLRIRG